MKYGLSSFGRDICAIWILTLVSIGLGIYSKEESSRFAGNENTLACPIFSLAEFRSYVQSQHFVILDARNRENYNQGHVPGALSLPASDFDAEYIKLEPKLASDKNQLIIVYCSDMWCGLGDDLQKKLIDRGFKHVGQFRDGWEAWQNSNLLEEKSL